MKYANSLTGVLYSAVQHNLFEQGSSQKATVLYPYVFLVSDITQ